MARIAGVDLPRNKRMEIALTYIHGIGKTTSAKLLDAVGIDLNMKSDQVTEEMTGKIRLYIEEHLKVEGDLRREKQSSIKRLLDLQCYRGIRHRRGLPVNGQRTRTNSRTRKGPKKTVAGKASVKSLKG